MVKFRNRIVHMYDDVNLKMYMRFYKPVSMISGSSWVLLYKDTLPDMVSVYKRKFCRFDAYSLCSRPLAVFSGGG